MAVRERLQGQEPYLWRDGIFKLSQDGTNASVCSRMCVCVCVCVCVCARARAPAPAQSNMLKTGTVSGLKVVYKYRTAEYNCGLDCILDACIKSWCWTALWTPLLSRDVGPHYRRLY
jgi:hypothetical protein